MDDNSNIMRLRDDLITTYGSYLSCKNESEKAKKYLRMQFVCQDLDIDFEYLLETAKIRSLLDREFEFVDIVTDGEQSLIATGQCHYCGVSLKDKRQGSLFCNSKHRASYHSQKKTIR